VLRLVLDLDGEVVVGVKAKVGYVHTGFEKNMEQKTWWKAITYAPRIDYVSFQNNELVFVLAVEKLLGLEIPPKATWMRMLLCELNRLHSHLVWLATSALELGAISMFWYAFREREMVLDLSELVAGYRMHTRYFQTGGLAEDIPPGFYPECRKFVEWMPKAIDDYDALLRKNEIWKERTKGLGLLNRADAIALGQTGPVLRASGVDWDLRRDEPYLFYDRVGFNVPVLPNGDSSGWKASRGRRTTGRWCCRRARSSTPRWSPSSTTSRSSPRDTACPRARSTSPSSPRAGSSAATSSPTAARGPGGSSSGLRRSRPSRRPRPSSSTATSRT